MSGITHCARCRGKLHIYGSADGKRRFICYNRTHGKECRQGSAFLSIYEEQIERYLETFHIPADPQEQLLAMHRKAQTSFDDAMAQRSRIETR
ncbi:MAG: recombinase zinc beta ribbon domain-containing protein [Chloroflexi bacterium]|nr:recombinase zinc beta ribbon domain-containing protein [Chloroflexota bacterium]